MRNLTRYVWQCSGFSLELDDNIVLQVSWRLVNAASESLQEVIDGVAILFLAQIET